MRLIDADAFLERIQNDASLCEEIKLYGLKVLKKYLDLQPTAYDIDKIMNELKQAIQNGTIKIEVGNSKLFEIVKQTGVSDDVCEWRKIKGNSCLFETNCGNISGMYRGFNFCPYCGKRIKVME